MTKVSRYDVVLSSALTLVKDLYGPLTDADKPATNGATNGVVDFVRRRTVVHLPLCDALPTHGAIADMASGVAWVGSAIQYEILVLTKHVGPRSS